MTTIYGENIGSPFAIVDNDGDLHVKATISGNIIIGSVTANVDSIYIESGANLTGSAYCYQVTDPWIIAGSISSMPSIETGSEIWIRGGSVETFGVGSTYSIITTPTLVSNNPYTRLVYIASGTSTGVTGSSIGSIIKFIGLGSYVKVLTYQNDNLINIGSWI